MKHQATFEITSKTDAYAVERSLTRLYNTIREETRSVRESTGDSTEMLEQFSTVRDAARNPAPGRLTVIYERKDESFEG